ncbi:MAG: hypothetical protein EBR51_02905, partial [Gammaproteobacteria bacterium]|nr:hypothetical protein [Gammaproteobacteria bacterium]
MLLFLAFVLQTLLLFDCLLRRVLQVVVPCKVAPLERYANTSLLSTLAANALNAATLPLQALATLVGSWTRYVALLVVVGGVFTVLLVLSPNAVFVYSTLTRAYNYSVTPLLATTKVVFILADVLWRAGAPLFNGAVFFASEAVRRVVVPLSRELLGDVVEGLQLLGLALGALGRSALG